VYLEFHKIPEKHNNAYKSLIVLQLSSPLFSYIFLKYYQPKTVL